MLQKLVCHRISSLFQLFLKTGFIVYVALIKKTVLRLRVVYIHNDALLLHPRRHEYGCVSEEVGHGRISESRTLFYRGHEINMAGF